jgi:DNA polymerase III epsilon subunit-like protein
MAAIDVETTGFLPGHNDIIEIAVLILDSDIKPDKRVLPFAMEMKPIRPENVEPGALKTNRIDFAKMMQRAADPFDVADYFEDWFEGLKKDTPKRPALLPEGRKIIPLAQNWPFDRSFIMEWLGDKSFNSFFHPWFRDTLPVAQFLNDQYANQTCCAMPHKVPFPKSNLTYLCSQLKVNHDRLHRALNDCVATAECYRRMVLGQIP